MQDPSPLSILKDGRKDEGPHHSGGADEQFRGQARKSWFEKQKPEGFVDEKRRTLEAAVRDPAKRTPVPASGRK